MRCPNCGVEVSPGTKFCYSCGASLQRIQAPMGQPVRPVRSVQPPKRGRGGCVLILVVGAVLGGLLILVLLALAAVWFITGGIPFLMPVTPTPAVIPPAPPVVPAAPGAAPSQSLTIPQECGMDSVTLDYGSIEVGSVVILGRHRPVDGYDNWDPGMDPYVGMQATVTSLEAVDPC